MAQTDSQTPLIVTDGTCTLPAELIAQYNIKVIPLKVHFGEETYNSGTEMTLPQFYERLARGDVHPRSSAYDSDEIKTFYEQFKAENRPILSVHISEKLSKVFAAAQEAASQLPDQTIRVWNSRTAAGALGFQVLTAARAAQAGCTIDQIIPLLEKIYQASQMLFCLDDLSFLHKGGRIGTVSYYVAQTLRLKPIITVSKTGETVGTYVAATERPHSMKAAVDSFVREVSIYAEPHSPLRALIAISSESSRDLADDLRAKLTERFQCIFLESTPITPVLAVHIGPRALGVAFATGPWEV
ncbi:MAG: DegV family protein [Chloroflexi bacterium]|nr:DegV family protein [Chloroflexota bacterium]